MHSIPTTTKISRDEVEKPWPGQAQHLQQSKVPSFHKAPSAGLLMAAAALSPRCSLLNAESAQFSFKLAGSGVPGWGDVACFCLTSHLSLAEFKGEAPVCIILHPHLHSRERRGNRGQGMVCSAICSKGGTYFHWTSHSYTQKVPEHLFPACLLRGTFLL